MLLATLREIEKKPTHYLARFLFVFFLSWFLFFVWGRADPAIAALLALIAASAVVRSIANHKVEEFARVVASSKELSKKEPGEHHQGEIFPPPEFRGYLLVKTPSGIPILSWQQVESIKNEKKRIAIDYGLKMYLLGCVFLWAILCPFMYMPGASLEILMLGFFIALLFSLLMGVFAFGAPIYMILIPRKTRQIEDILFIQKIANEIYEPIFKKIGGGIAETKTSKMYEIEFALKESPDLVFRIRPEKRYSKDDRDENKILYFEASGEIPPSNAPKKGAPSSPKSKEGMPFKIVECNGFPRIYMEERVFLQNAPRQIPEIVEAAKKTYLEFK